MEYLVIFASGLLKNGTKAFQQDNVTRRNWAWVPPTSYALSGWDVLWFGGMAAAFNNNGLLGMALAWFLLGTGSWMGTCLSMRIHDRWAK